MNDEKKQKQKELDNQTKTKLNQVIKEIKQTSDDKLTTATRTSQILEAYKGHKKELGIRRTVEEPVMLFGRRSGAFEIYERVTQGRFDFRHSNGDERFIIIDPNTQSRLGTGRGSIRMYWAHEDHPVTGWPEPVTTTEQINIFVEKTLADAREWMLKKDKMKMQWILYIAGAIAIVLLAVGLMKSISPSPVTIVQQVASNVTPMINETARVMLNNGSQIL